MDASLRSAEINNPLPMEKKKKFDEVDSSGPMEVQVTELDSVSRDEMNKIKEKEIELKRKELQLNFMEKIYSFIKGPEDLPVALQYMKEVNIQMDRLSKGSVIFSIYIGSLDALQQFEKLWRYGGLKSLLDKEMLGEDMLKALKETARENGHPVDNIKSELKVFETDIERCRSSLMKSSFERLQLEHTAVSSRSHITPVVGVFKDWLNTELGKYLANIDDATSQHLITLGVH
ncbi:uncharacterized protein LOC132760511 [Ruditapes philippinarum]|uniref:uncharacterized protein LOC132760511 n=1 Tax=Ruditapes philippinarum TaxID=129788 RepID=UPI00295B3F07|nr:uncharacterized protein LOC132760511 [Ruditapes philippinarum]